MLLANTKEPPYILTSIAKSGIDLDENNFYLILKSISTFM